MKWACGLTTVPIRRETLLPQTVAAIVNAGFPVPRLFIDGDRGGFSVGAGSTAHYPALGVVGNWWVGLVELYARNPDADWFAMFQDDVLLAKNVRQLIEASGIPEKRWLNLVTHPDAKGSLAPLAPGGNGATWFVTRALINKKPGPGGVTMQKGAGACALAFPRGVVAALLACPTPAFNPNGLDGMIVDTLNRLGYQEMAHSPSLGIHTGAVSTLPGSKPQRVSNDFVGVDFDAMQFARANNNGID
jgi:hypothetical protein